MPGEEDDDLIMETTQADLAPNERCPLSYKKLLEIEEPVKCATWR